VCGDCVGVAALEGWQSTARVQTQEPAKVCDRREHTLRKWQCGPD
jgi:hypothetical protein